MRRVDDLKKELDKFPDDAWAFAYEGEVNGLIICRPNGGYVDQGTIFCGESAVAEPQTIVPEWASNK